MSAVRGRFLKQVGKERMDGVPVLELRERCLYSESSPGRSDPVAEVGGDRDWTETAAAGALDKSGGQAATLGDLFLGPTTDTLFSIAFYLCCLTEFAITYRSQGCAHKIDTRNIIGARSLCVATFNSV